MFFLLLNENVFFIVVVDQHFEVCSASFLWHFFAVWRQNLMWELTLKWAPATIAVSDIETNTFQLISISHQLKIFWFFESAAGADLSAREKKSVSQLKTSRIDFHESLSTATTQKGPREEIEKRNCCFFFVYLTPLDVVEVVLGIYRFKNSLLLFCFLSLSLYGFLLNWKSIKRLKTEEILRIRELKNQIEFKAHMKLVSSSSRTQFFSCSRKQKP